MEMDNIELMVKLHISMTNVWFTDSSHQSHNSLVNKLEILSASLGLSLSLLISHSISLLIIVRVASIPVS